MQQQKGQVQIVVIGLVVVAALLILHFTGVLGGKKDNEEEPVNEEQEQEVANNASGPQRSNLYPTGTLPAGTKETKISLSTNVAAYCRYSTKPDVSYSKMSSRFSYNDDKTFHEFKVGNLESGKIYEYYVRCRDMSDNINTEDVLIRFSVGSSSPFSGYNPYQPSSGVDEIPPLLANLFPTGVLPGGTTQTEISVTTNEQAYCRYSTKPGVSYSKMSSRFSYDNDKLVHTETVSGLEDNKIYEYYVRCKDKKGNVNTSDMVIKFGIGGVAHSLSSPSEPGQDITPPYRYNGLPDDDLDFSTKSTTLSLQTDEIANCRYYDVSGLSYGQMKKFSNTDDFFHSTEALGLSEGQEYTYYIKCADQHGNTNTDDYVISFEVEEPKDLTPPVISNLYPDRDLYYGTTETLISVRTNEPAYCRYSTEEGIEYKSMKKSFSREEGNLHVATVSDLENGVYYTYFIRCKDMEGNVNTGDVMLRFRVTP